MVGSLGMLQIFLSLPVAYFVYAFIFSIPTFMQVRYTVQHSL